MLSAAESALNAGENDEILKVVEYHRPVWLNINEVL